jgi:V-type H+-transporting ATPase subunit a
MKTSVIFGVLHMLIGVLIKGTNAIYFRHAVVFICEVIGGFVILFGLFGWMDLLIFFKWFYPVDI